MAHSRQVVFFSYMCVDFECISYTLHYVSLDNLGFLMGYEPFDIRISTDNFVYPPNKTKICENQMMNIIPASVDELTAGQSIMKFIDFTSKVVENVLH